MPKELYQEIKEEVPKEIGVYGSYEYKDNILLELLKKPKKQDLKVEMDILKNSMIRSLSREVTKFYNTCDEKYINKLKKRIDKLEKSYKESENRRMESSNELFFIKDKLENPSDYYAMSEVMWAGSISHNGLTGLGGVGDWATHALGQQLSAFYDIAHGASLAVMWEYWARYVYKEKVSRFARYARNVWGVDDKEEEAAALSGIEKTSEFFESIGMPTSISSAEEIGHLDDTALKDLAFGTTFELKRTIGNFKKLEYDDIYNIFKSANN
jgi:hypothetical protein